MLFTSKKKIRYYSTEKRNWTLIVLIRFNRIKQAVVVVNCIVDVYWKKNTNNSIIDFDNVTKSRNVIAILIKRRFEEDRWRSAYSTTRITSKLSFVTRRPHLYCETCIQFVNFVWTLANVTLVIDYNNDIGPWSEPITIAHSKVFLTGGYCYCSNWKNKRRGEIEETLWAKKNNVSYTNLTRP